MDRVILKKPRLKRTVQVLCSADGERVLLLSGRRTLLLRSSPYRRLLPLLDGTHTIESIVAAMKPVNAKTVLGAIHELRREGFVVDDEWIPAAQPPCWEHQGPDRLALKGAGVAVRAIGGIHAEPYAAALLNMGLETTSDPLLDVVVVDDYLSEEVREFARKARRPWLLTRPAGDEIWIGPIFVRGEGVCWECLAHRLRANDAIRQFARSAGLADRPAPGLIPSVEAFAAQWIAHQAAHWIAGPRPHPLRDTVLTWNPAEAEPQTHVVARWPLCPLCGQGGHPRTCFPPSDTPHSGVATTQFQRDSDRGSPGALRRDGLGIASHISRSLQPVSLRESLSVVATEGGYRSVPIGEALRRLQRHVSPLTGIIHSLRAVPGSSGLHVFTAKVYPERPLADWSEVESAERYFASGKGTTDKQAQVGALAEAIERYCATYHGDEPFVEARFTDLGERAVHPDMLTLFSLRQFKDRERTNASAPYDLVPRPFDENDVIQWTPAWSLTRSDWRLVPLTFCYFGAAPRDSTRYCISNSNGNAAGFSLEEAILQGFLELIERDASAIWWYNRIPRPAVALEGIDDDYVGRLRELYAEMGRTFWLLDITSDFGIPAFAAVTRKLEGPEQMCCGMGCHFDPRVAALRALTEMNQVLPNILQFAEREDRRLAKPGHLLQNLLLARLAEHPYLAPDPSAPPRRVSEFTPRAFTDLAAAVRHAVDLVRERGLEFMVHDMTRPELDLSVVKVIVPGLRLPWRRAAPGRLYDVPVRMGWRPVALREEELNPLDLMS